MHLIGSPRVGVAVHGFETHVFVTNKPWGMADPAKVFLGLRPDVAGRKALQYAAEVQKWLDTSATEEAMRLQRGREARRDEKATAK